MKNERGMAMFIILLIVALIAPVVFVLSKWTSRMLLGHTYEKTLKNPQSISTVVITDYMRQLSQDFYEDHYASYQTSKPQYDFSSYGLLTTPTIACDRNLREMLITGQGNFWKNTISASQTMQAQIRFRNDISRFAMIATGSELDLSSIQNLQVNAGGSLMLTGFVVPSVSTGGAIYAPAGVKATGLANGVIIRGPVVSPDHFNATPQYAFTGPVFTTGTFPGGNPVTVNTYVPTVDVIAPDLSRYAVKNNYSLINNGNSTPAPTDTWSFNGTTGFFIANTNVPQFDIRAPKTVSGSGAILYAVGYDITITQSQLNGRATVVCVRNAAGVGGHVTITGNIRYKTGVISDSFAVLAEDGITFDNSGAGGDMDVRGLYYIPEGGASPPTLDVRSGGGSEIFNMVGTLMAPADKISSMFASGFFAGGRNFTFDPNLMWCFPPGLPERPRLIRWRLSNQ